MKHAKYLILAALLYGAPVSAFASVQITEIMYDLSGTDTGREWVEVTNTGGVVVDFAGYKFFEANTNHALVLTAGSGVLQPGASAILADDATKFLIDWPSYSGALFDSSFSLSNTGETIAIKDGTLAVLDTVTYDSSQGAAGDGNTLQRLGSTFVAAAPTPGSYSSGSGSGSSGSSSQNSTSDTGTSTSQPITTSGGSPPPITLSITADVLVMVGGGSFFSATAFGTQGVPLPAPRIIWNFGDGSTAEGARVFHAYSYPGRYVVVATAAYNYSSAMARGTVEAVPAAVALRAEVDGSLTVTNKSTRDLNVGLWALRDGAAHYTIPENTLVLPGEGVRFAPAVLGFAGGVSSVLDYPNDAVAAAAAPAQNSPLRGERVLAAVLQTQKPPASRASGPGAAAPGGVLGTSTEKSAGTPNALLWSLLGLAAVLGIGAGGAAYLRPREPSDAETSLTADEFEIEE